MSYRSFVTYINPKSIWNDPQSSLLPLDIETVPVSTPIPMKVYGVHYVSSSGTGTNIYAAGDDYLYYPVPYNFLAWNPAGPEPASGSWYYASYFTEENLPHNKIKLFDKMTYGGSVAPKLYYKHAHRVPNTTGFSLFSGAHGHNEIFGKMGIKLLMNATTDYYDVPRSWNGLHRHEISPYLLGYMPSDPEINYESDKDDLFFSWSKISYRPTSVVAKVSPILSPNNVNFKTQRTYVDQLFKIMLNKNLNKDSAGDLKSPTEIPEDRANGYYVGNQDFRASYFGNDLKYSAGSLAGGDVLPVGSPLNATKLIYVDDNPLDDSYINYSSISPVTYNTLIPPTYINYPNKINNIATYGLGSPTYMKITDVPTLGYKAYTYRQIPKNGSMVSTDSKTVSDGGIIFVRDGVIKIGGADRKGTIKSSVYSLGSIFGNNTIIDGRLTIVSYSETKPGLPFGYIDNNINTSNDNPGDIVITGNVIYKNKISKSDSDIAKKDYVYDGFRQYISSKPINLSPVDPTDYITASDGKPMPSIPVGEKVNSLALIASNDIKIPVSNFNQTDTSEEVFTTPVQEDLTSGNPNSSGCPCKDTLTVHGQLVAGHKITQTKVDDAFTSKNDRIILYGSFYSYEPPNLAYFGRSSPDNRNEEGLGRMYLYDKTLAQLPLAGSPRFPKDTSYSIQSYPVVASGLPRIIPGTWKVVSDGTQ